MVIRKKPNREHNISRQRTAMNDVVRQKLKELVRNEGDRFYLDGRVCRYVLADSCAGFKKETTALIAAVEEGVTSTLLKSRRHHHD